MLLPHYDSKKTKDNDDNDNDDARITASKVAMTVIAQKANLTKCSGGSSNSSFLLLCFHSVFVVRGEERKYVRSEK